MTWRDDAACRDHIELEIFYPLGHKSKADQWITQEAKATCAGCPVTEQCLAAADGWGIWAGLDAYERNATKVSKKKLPAPHGTPAGAKAHSRAGEPACRACLDGANLAKRLRREYAARGRIAAGLNMRRVS